MIWGQSEEMGSIDEVDSHPVPSSYCTGPGSANVHVLQNIRYFTIHREILCKLACPISDMMMLGENSLHIHMMTASHILHA